MKVSGAVIHFCVGLGIMFSLKFMSAHQRVHREKRKICHILIYFIKLDIFALCKHKKCAPFTRSKSFWIRTCTHNIVKSEVGYASLNNPRKKVSRPPVTYTMATEE